jgi:hypothetical protein
MNLIQNLVTKANKNFDVYLIGDLKVKFKEKKYTTAWVTYIYPNKKQMINCLATMVKGNYPPSPKF